VTSNYRYCGSVTDILEITRADTSMQVRPGVDCLCEEDKRQVMKRVVEWRDCGIGSFGQSVNQSKIGYCQPICIWKTHRTKPFLGRNCPFYVRYDGTPSTQGGTVYFRTGVCPFNAPGWPGQIKVNKIGPVKGHRGAQK